MGEPGKSKIVALVLTREARALRVDETCVSWYATDARDWEQIRIWVVVALC